MFTFSASITPRFASVSIGFGVPNSTSENSVPHHGTAPSIRKSATKCLTDQCLRFADEHPIWVICNAAGNLTVDCSWLDFCFVPQISCVCSGALFKPSLICQTVFRIPSEPASAHLMSKIIDIFAFCLYTPLFCDADQFLRIFYLIIAVCFCTYRVMTDLTSMIGMCSCSACCKFRRKFLPTIPCTSHPQIPLGAFGVIRHGPMEQIRQQIPCSPNLQCGVWFFTRNCQASAPTFAPVSNSRLVAASNSSTVVNLNSLIIDLLLMIHE